MEFLLILVNIFLAICGQLTTKIGINKIGSFSSMPIQTFIFKCLTSPLVILGFGLYFFSALIWFMVLSRINLSVAYPTLSLGYILILITSAIFLKEPIGLAKIMGSLLICAGVFLIFRK